MIEIPNIDTRYLLFFLTILIILCAMFTKSPSLDDAAKITLGATLNALAAVISEKRNGS